MTTKVSHARSTVNSSRSSALYDLLQAPSCLASDPKSRYPFTVYRFSHTMKHRPFTHGSRLHGPRSATRCDVLPAPGSRLPAILRLTPKAEHEIQAQKSPHFLRASNFSNVSFERFRPISSRRFARLFSRIDSRCSFLSSASTRMNSDTAIRYAPFPRI